MKFSVIIPMKNEENYIERAIMSALVQEVVPEIIVVDDHSTDGSYEVIKKYINKNQIQYKISDGNGVSEARNTGIRISTGDYLLFLDADDTLHEDALKTIRKYALNNSPDIIFNGYTRVRDDQSIIKPFSYKYVMGKGRDIISDYLNKKAFTHLGALCFNKEFIMSNALSFNVTLDYAEDFNFVVQSLYYAQEVSCTNKEIYNWTLRLGSTLYKKDIRKFTVFNSFVSTREFLHNVNMINDEIETALMNQYAMMLLDCVKSLLWLGYDIPEINREIKRNVDFAFVRPMRKLSSKVRKDIFKLCYLRGPYLRKVKKTYIPNNFSK